MRVGSAEDGWKGAARVQEERGWGRVAFEMAPFACPVVAAASGVHAWAYTDTQHRWAWQQRRGRGKRWGRRWGFKCRTPDTRCTRTKSSVVQRPRVRGALLRCRLVLPPAVQPAARPCSGRQLLILRPELSFMGGTSPLTSICIYGVGVYG
jgi:hypothetical protein